jgi:hypothetical protein
VARGITLAGLLAGAAALAGLLAWALYTRQTWEPGLPLPGRWSVLGRGLVLMAHHPDFALGATILAALIAAAIALAVLVRRRQRWAYLVTGLGGAALIAAPWLARAYVKHVETVAANPRWAARSPYVAAATHLAIALTIALALLAAAALIALATAPRRAGP